MSNSQAEIYVSKNTLHKVHLFASSILEVDPNRLSMVHIFPDVVLASDSNRLVAYNMKEQLSASGNLDQYELLIGQALPAGVWADMVANPWMVELTTTGEKVIYIQKKGYVQEYIVTEENYHYLLEVYLELSSYRDMKDHKPFFPTTSVAQLLAKMFKGQLAIITRRKKIGFKKDSAGANQSTDEYKYLHQIVQEHNFSLVVYQQYMDRDLNDFPAIHSYF